MLLEDFINSFFIENGVDFDEIFDRFVSLVEPELIKIKDRSKVTRAIVGAGKPDGVSFGFTKLATSDRVDNEWSGPNVSATVF